jgi:hypothetical protein
MREMVLDTLEDLDDILFEFEDEREDEEDEEPKWSNLYLLLVPREEADGNQV